MIVPAIWTKKTQKKYLKKKVNKNPPTGEYSINYKPNNTYFFQKDRDKLLIYYTSKLHRMKIVLTIWL